MISNNNILILGCTGMFGSNIYNYLSYKKINTYILTHKPLNKKNYLLINKIIDKKSFYKYTNKINNIIKNKKISIVINCLGYTKHAGLKNFSYQKLINTDLPKELSNITNKNNSYLIHFSTDCVFSGKKGNYTEKDIPDYIDNYGKYKFLGEKLNGKNYVVLRTSGIGHEYKTKKNLLEWFLNTPSNANVLGFGNSFFSGPTTIEIAEIIYKFFIKKKIRLNGIFNLGTKKINKYELLCLINKIYNTKKKIIEEKAGKKIDRSLISKKISAKLNYNFKSWNIMIHNMYKLNKIFKKNRNEYII